MSVFRTQRKNNAQHLVSNRTVCLYLCRHIFTLFKSKYSSILLCMFVLLTVYCTISYLRQMHGKEEISRKYAFNWICQHIPRLVMWMHRYINHTLTVGYSTIPEEDDVPTEKVGRMLVARILTTA